MAELTANQLGASAHDDHEYLSEDEQNNNLKLGVWIYLASEIVIFSIMIVGYVIFRINEPAVVAEAHEQLGVGLVTANTFVLLASSFFMVMGLRAMQQGNRAGMLRWIALTAAGGAVFLIGQYIEYSELSHLGIVLGYTDSQWSTLGMRFYAPTFFHGAHVFVGVIWALEVVAARRQRSLRP